MVMDINIKSTSDVARSLLGLFALIGKPCKLVAEDSTDYKILARVARKAGVA